MSTKCLYLCNETSEYFLHLDDSLRLLSTAAKETLFGVAIPNGLQRFSSKSSPPIRYGSDLPQNCTAYSLERGEETLYYIADEYPWQEGQLCHRLIVNETQEAELGIENYTPWTGSNDPAFSVPLAIASGRNWHLATFISGYHAYYNHLCHPENPINSYFKSWLGNQFTKPELKRRIIVTQTEINALDDVRTPPQPEISPATAPLHHTEIEVTLSCSKVGAAIYYSIDGEVPIPGGEGHTMIYNGPFTLTMSTDKPNVVVKAVSEYKDSVGVSEVTEVTYTYEEATLPPITVSPQPSDVHSESPSITLSCTDEDVRIYYTLDGSTPDKTSEEYSNAITLALGNGNPITLKAIGVHQDYLSSTEILNETYTYTMPTLSEPTFSPVAGNFLSPIQYISLNSPDVDADIKYGLSGNEPSLDYTVPIELDFTSNPGTAQTIKAKCDSLSGESNPSDVVSSQYSCILSWEHAWQLMTDPDDSIGSLNFENLNNEVVFDTTSGGNAAKFNGNSLLTGQADTDLLGAEFFVSFWVTLPQTLSTTDYETLIAFQKSSSSSTGLSLMINSKKIKLEIETASGKVISKTMSFHFTPGQRVQYVLQYDGTTLVPYRNGRWQSYQDLQIETEEGTKSDLSKRISLGGILEGGSVQNGFNGYIDSVYYMSSAIEVDQVKQFYQQQSTMVHP